MLSDLRHALRTLRKSPGFTAVAVLTLAVAIGACTTVFSLVNGVLLRALALPEPGRLVSVRESIPAFSPDPMPVNAYHYVTWRARAAAFADLGLIAPSSISLTGAGEPQRLNVAYVTASVFSTLRVAPVLGRAFQPDEEAAGHNQIVVLTDALWRRQFQADPAVIGRTIMLDQAPHTVVGVLPAGLHFPDLRQLGWTPAGFIQPELFKPKYFAADELAEKFGRHNYTVIARLGPGLAPAAAQLELNSIAQAITRDAGVPQELRAVVTPLQEVIVHDSRRSLFVLFGSVAAVLLIACVNLASLLLARMEHRRGEAALRLALGASRGQVLRLALLEPLLIAALGGAGGLIIAVNLLDLLPHFAPAGFPRLDEIALDGRVFSFALLLSTASALLTGFFPAWQLARHAPGHVLAAGGRTLAGSGRTGRSHRLLLTAQIALSVLLLAAAGLLSHSLARLGAAEQGYGIPGAIAADLTAPIGRYRTDEQRIAFYDLLLQRLATTPGINSAAICSLLPLQGETWVDKVHVPGDARPAEAQPSTNTRFISADYFNVVGLRMLSGRTFTPADRARKAVVISRQLADILWPGQDPVGRTLVRGEDEAFEVVGVATDVRAQAGKNPVPTLYRQFTEWPPRNTFLVVNSPLPAAAAVPVLRAAVHALDPDVPLVSIRTLSDIASGAVAPQRFQTVLAVSFAATAALLTAIGLFGVSAYSVACRQREFGVRLALGAAPGALPGQVIRQYLAPVGAGLAAGLGLLLAAGHWLDGLLFDTSVRDPAVLGAVALLIVAVSTLATWLPARRAAKVDPMVALRAE